MDVAKKIKGIQFPKARWKDVLLLIFSFTTVGLLVSQKTIVISNDLMMPIGIFMAMYFGYVYYSKRKEIPGYYERIEQIKEEYYKNTGKRLGDNVTEAYEVTKGTYWHGFVDERLSICWKDGRPVDQLRYAQLPDVIEEIEKSKITSGMLKESILRDKKRETLRRQGWTDDDIDKMIG